MATIRQNKRYGTGVGSDMRAHASPFFVQPAVVISLGTMGLKVTDTLIERKNVRSAFHGVSEFSQSAHIGSIHIPDIETLGVDRSTPVEFRKEFLNQVPNLAKIVLERFDIARQHRRHPEATFIRPTIYVVGAPWEVAATALFWPVAALVRCILGDGSAYGLDGIFIAANNGNKGNREREDARLFATFVEGDALRSWVPTWWSEMRDIFKANALPALPPGYDRVLLLDGLKANNGTVSTDDSTGEIVSHATNLLEGLIFSNVPRLLDDALLDDFQPDERQAYISAGSSALAVPLSQIRDQVMDYSVSVLTREHLLQASEADLQASRVKGQALATRIVTNLNGAALRIVRETLKPFSSDGLQLSSGALLKLQIDVEQPQPDAIPVVRKVSTHAPNPLSLANASYERINALLNEEIRSNETVCEYINGWLESEMHRVSLLMSADNQVKSMSIATLRQGDSGLVCGVELLSATAAKLRSYREKMLQPNPDKAVRLERSRDRLTGATRQRFNRRLLRPVIQAAPKLPSILARTAILYMVLFQYYWIGLANGVLYWPLNLFPPALFADAEQTQPWGRYLILILAIAAAIMVLVTALGPWFLRRSVLPSHRGNLETFIKGNLQETIRLDALKKLESVIDHVERQREGLHSNVEALTAQSRPMRMENGAEPHKFQNYLEYVVVNTSSVVEPFQKAAVQQVRNRNSERILDTWLDGDQDGSVGITGPDEQGPEFSPKEPERIKAFLQKKVKEAIDEIAAKPALSYVHPAQYSDWFHTLWQSSVPWIRTTSFASIGGKSISASKHTSEHLEFSAVLIKDAERVQFGRVARQEAGNCHVLEWPDPYRVLMLRLLGGVSTEDISRMTQLRHAFQLLPNDEKELITQEERIFAPYNVANRGPVQPKASPPPPQKVANRTPPKASPAGSGAASGGPNQGQAAMGNEVPPAPGSAAGTQQPHVEQVSNPVGSAASSNRPAEQGNGQSEGQAQNGNSPWTAAEDVDDD